MKSTIKLGLAAITVFTALSLGSCSGKKASGSTDSTTTTVKVDSTVKTTSTIDSIKTDTAKKDTTKM